MKFLVVFAAVIAVALASPNMWTLNELDDAIQNPTTSSTFKPVLMNALDAFMSNIFNGHAQGPMAIKTQAGPIGTYSLTELSDAIESNEVDAIFKPYLEDALNEMMVALFAGETVEPVTVNIPALSISAWTLRELDEALSSPDTNPELMPYLTDALDNFMSALFLGQSINNIVVAAPADLFAPPITASPVAVANPSPAAELPTSSPLVQIILNVQNNQVVDMVHPSPIIDRPTPEPSLNPIDLIAALPVEALEPSPAVVIGPMV